ncbi:YbaB/EbfC family nucleoid-associated protein [Nocardia sp. NPDC003963]
MAAELDLDGAIAGFAQMAADAERRAQRFAELQERMTALTATDTGAGGRVSVTVDSSGVPTAIDLAPGVREMDSRVLSAEILSCMRRAQGKLGPGVAGMVQDIVGEDPAGAALIDGFNRRFPEPEPGATTSPDSGPPPTDPYSPQHRPATPTWDSTPTPQTADPHPPQDRRPSPVWGSAPSQPTADPYSAQHRPMPSTWDSTSPPAHRKPGRDQVVTPEEPDEEDEYYRRKSWLE